MKMQAIGYKFIKKRNKNKGLDHKKLMSDSDDFSP